MADPGEMVEMLQMAGDQGSSQAPIHEYSFDSAIAATVNIADLKPIIVMANLATVSEEVQVSSQLPVAHQVEVSPAEGTSHSEFHHPEASLRTHLMSSRSSSATKSRKITSEVYHDGDTGVTYEILRGGTSRGKDKLIDSLGFTYNMKQGRGNKNVTYWWCAVRNTHLRCPASVVQHDNVFIRGKRKHEHMVGESTPKPHAHATVKKGPLGRPPGSTLFAKKASNRKRSNYNIILEGSKSGKDLLRDKLGYTYTQKKVCKDGRCYWICSIRNNHLRCPAMVIQLGNSFAAGTQPHKHMPGSKVPAGENDIIPSMDDSDVDFDDKEENYGEEFDESSTGDDSQNYHSYNRTSSKPNPLFGTVRVKQMSKLKDHRYLARESKRREHPTFLGPSCTINLTKCDDPSCNCRMVHCPFCDTSHFIPAKAGRVQDHLELTHFAHGVQYDDLMIVKCFQDCSMERNFGHYHCVFCSQQILKRNSYARHMLRHMRKMSIPDRLLVLPDSKFPDVINAYGYEIPICKKVSCQPTREKHYHCPQCEQVCRERSLTVNHLWRCLQKKTAADVHMSDEDEMANTVDESQLNLHFSHTKSFKELPLEKCTKPACCNQMYHCKLCPTNLFRPSYRQHLLAHYITHWKQRVPYKGYALLKCFHTCEGIDRRYFKTKFHFHCPICCKIILTKGSFEEHIKGCHMFKFGENLLEDPAEDMNSTMEEDVTMLQELAPIHDNVEYMEDKLTAQAVALEEQKQLERKCRTPLSAKRTPQYSGKVRVALKKTPGKIGGSAAEEMYGKTSDDELDYKDEGNSIVDDVFGLNISDEEIFDLGSVIFSEKFIEALTIVGAEQSVLNKVALQTGTKLAQEGHRYLLSGRIEDLFKVKKIISKALTGFDGAEESGELSHKKKGGIQTGKSKTSSEESYDVTKRKGSSTKSSGKNSGKKGLTPKASAAKDKPNKKGESFPYSEIKEIIKASKQTDVSSKRGRGRPPKKQPITSKITKKEPAKLLSKEPTTPSRYGTRGVKRNYLELNSGIARTQIKVELESENEESTPSDENPPKRRQLHERVNSESEVTGEEESANEDEEDEENENSENLDDSEQEEMDQESFDQEKIDSTDRTPPNDKSIEETLTKKLISIAPGKKDKITDSTVQGLKTSNVSSSVPLISKVGFRPVACGQKKMKKAAEEFQELKRITDEAKTDSLMCSLCDDFTAGTFAEMTVHLMTFHHVYEPPRCDICETDLDNSHSLKLHIERKHGPQIYMEEFKCQYEDCDKAFTSLSGLKAHINAVHIQGSNVPKEKRHFCDKCEFQTNFIKDLYEHKAVEHEETIQCEPCNKTFASYQTFKAHNDLKHGYSSLKTCSVCHQTFSDLAALHKHLREHKSSLMCSLCQKTVSTKASLEAHMETHKPEEERKYKFVCSFCGKKFLLKTNYEDHLNKHTGNRPYKCDQCDKRFGFRSMLKKHKTFIHSTDRPFKCGYCMKGFKFMNLLNNHVTVHTNQSKHVCATCNKTFSTASTLKLHSQKCPGAQPAVTFATIATGETLLIKDENATSLLEQQPIDIALKDKVQQDGVTNISFHQAGDFVEMAIDHAVHGVGIGVTNETQPTDVMSFRTQNGVTGQVDVTGLPVDTSNVTPAQSAEIEVYACSECRATFDNLQHAEFHVLTAHSQVA